MRRVLRIALRDFLAVVARKSFVLGALVTPAVIAAIIHLGPRYLHMLDQADLRIEGEFAVLDPTGRVLPEMERALDARGMAEGELQELRRNLGQAPESARALAEAAIEQARRESQWPAGEVRLIPLPEGTEMEAAKARLKDETGEAGHRALIVIHEDAVETADPEAGLGTYDLYVPPGLDERELDFMHRIAREAIVNARVSARGQDRSRIESLVRVARQPSTTVGAGDERQTVRGFTFILPAAFAMLLFMGVMTGGQTLLTSMVEEKSSRVVEVLLSAVSPMELMAGKLIGGVAVSLVTMAVYLLTGLAMLASFSLLGLLDPWLILYLVIFFLIGFFTLGALMLAAGAAVNDMNEAGPLMAPLMLVSMAPWLLWPLVSRDPGHTVAIVASYLPPVNTYGMLMRMASTQPPPWWEVWLSIAVGAASVVGAVWVAAKVFRIGLLMQGKPPGLKTLLAWIRAA